MAVPRYFVLSILFLSYAIGGGGMVAMKLALASFAPAHIALARVFFAGIFYLLLLKKWYRIPYQKGDWKYLASIGIFDPGLFFLLQSFAMKYTTASQGGAIAASYPVITAFMARIFLKEKINPLTIFAIFVCTVGVVGNAFFASVGSEALNPVLGNSLVLLAMFFSYCYAVCARKLAGRYPLLSIAAIQTLGGMCIFLPLALWTPFSQKIIPQALWSMGYLGLFAGLFLYLAINYALQHIQAGTVALFSNLIPLFVIVFSYFLLDERLTAVQGVCLLLTVGGVCLAIYGQKK